MNDFSISMALVDYIPVVLFFFASSILMRDLYNKMTKASFALFAAGSLNITIAGALKATWKLLYAASICNFEALDHMFFPVQSIGFLLAGAGILMMLFKNPNKGASALAAVAPPIFSGTFVFVGLMVAGLGIMDAVLCILAVKLKKPWIIALLTVSFVCSLGMGYLSSQDFAEASMNWIAEGVNVVGQGTLLLSVVLLDKNGLAELKMHRGEEA
jgi:hypothetical protein